MGLHPSPLQFDFGTMRVYRVLYAANRVGSSSTNWGNFQKRLPPGHAQRYKDFINQSQTLAGSVVGKPESSPEIDFNFYKRRLSNPAFVDQLEQLYKSVNIPYPKDTENLLEKVETQRKQDLEQTKQVKELVLRCVSVYENSLAALETLPALENMTKEMLYYYFPATMNRESVWPHTINKCQTTIPGTTYYTYNIRPWEIEKQF